VHSAARRSIVPVIMLHAERRKLPADFLPTRTVLEMSCEIVFVA